MPSKEQKKINKRELREEQRIIEQQQIMAEKEWEKGVNTKGILKKQMKHDKKADKIRRKKENKELFELDMNIQKK